MDRISRARLLAVGVGAAAAVVAAPLAPAFAAPNPQGDDLGFVGFAATTELVLLSLYGRALNAKVLSRAESAAVQHMREDDRKHYDALVPLLGEAAPVASGYDISFPKGTFDSSRAILREAVKLERLLVGTPGHRASPPRQDDETRLLLARILESDSVHLAAAQSALALRPGLRAGAALAAQPRGVGAQARRLPQRPGLRRHVGRVHHVPEVRPMLRSLRTRHRSALLAVGVAAALAAPASASALTVSAAASLRDVLPKIDGSPTYNFAGSDALALQIRNGAPADVFLSANLSIPTQLFKDGLCTEAAGRSRPTSSCMVTPTANPAGIKNVYDLGRGERKRLAIGSATVPIGIYTRAGARPPRPLAGRCASTPSARSRT